MEAAPTRHGTACLEPGFGDRRVVDAPRPPAPSLTVALAALRDVRELCRRTALAAGLPPERVDDLVQAVHEVAAARAAGGAPARVAVWVTPADVVVELRAEGTRPVHEQVLGGDALSIVRRLADGLFVQTGPQGSLVRVRVGLRSATGTPAVAPWG
ncbi:ATP-binding protein [Kineococcus sp. SYSU DK004]|uniref:ATP-binding protein n=1 Tax=Kineococcus sp. SYSU DK004 TaxID=3383125 RepID=UPI003D7F0024